MFIVICRKCKKHMKSYADVKFIGVVPYCKVCYKVKKGKK